MVLGCCSWNWEYFIRITQRSRVKLRRVNIPLILHCELVNRELISRGIVFLLEWNVFAGRVN